MAWTVALLLWAIPVVHQIKHFEDTLEDVEDWMRSGPGLWFPSIAPYVAVTLILLWPLDVLGAIFFEGWDDDGEIR